MTLDILAISAHPDDVEAAAGGTILHHIALGKKVGLMDLTKAELSTRGNVPQRSAEAFEAAKVLGTHTRVQLDLPDGFFKADPESLLKIVTVIRQFQPEIILANATDDRHPDHQRAADMVVQATFLANLVKVVSYDDQGKVQPVWRTRAVYHYVQDRTLQPDLLVDITSYIDRKFEAIKAYKSQFYNPDCFDPETPISCPSYFEALRGRNAMLGRQIGVDYAEAFTVARAPGVRNLLDLL